MNSNKEILKRLDKLEIKEDNLKVYRPLFSFIEKGAYYSELTDDLKGLYCLYKGYDRETYESMLLMISGDLKDQLTYNEPFNPNWKPSEEDLKSIEELWESL